MTQHDILSLLFCLYELAREDHTPRCVDLGARAGLDAVTLEAALRHLEGRGLVDAAARKLSLRGFAVAHALCVQAACEQTARAA